MTQITKETITTQPTRASATPVVAVVESTKATPAQTLTNLIYFLFGVLEFLLAFRLILKLMGASTGSAFVRFIYAVTGVAILPFEGIFRRGFSQGIETTSVLEPSTIVALFVYVVIAWGIGKLIQISTGEKIEE